MVKKDLRVEIFVLCDTAVISRDNKLSIVGIFDQIVTDKIPFNFPKMALVAVIGGEPQSSHSLRLAITDPEGKEVTGLNMQVNLGANGSSNLISEITNFPLPQTGLYKISLFKAKVELASKPLNVSKTAAKSPLVS